MISRFDRLDFASARSWSRFPSRDGTDRDVAVLVYVLYALGFFTGITAPVGFVLAWWRRRTASTLVRTHLEWQVWIFAWGLVALLAGAILHAMVLGLAAITFGFGLLFMVVPWALGGVWLIGTIWAIAHGLRRLNRDLPIG